jgi:hypothetical protein
MALSRRMEGMAMMWLRTRRVLFLCAMGPSLVAGTVLAQVPQQVPPPAFDSQTPPAQPDYRLDSAWAALPGLQGPADTRPAGLRPRAGKRDVDVFYVHPTTYRTPDRWNMDLGNELVKRWTDVSVIARQAAVFNICCRVFAPRYRQASFLATSDRFMTGDGGKAYALAYTDILHAFDQWQAHRNQGRPFILAGHSQGGEMLMRLLADRIDSTPLQKRMVAAFAIGIDFSEGYFGRRYKTLRPCDRPSQVHCVLSWNAVTTEAKVDFLNSMTGARYARAYGTDEGRRPLCINPLTFDRRKPAAPATKARGSVPGDPGEGPVRALVRGNLAARCDRGFLVVEAAPQLALKPLPGGSMHYHEYGMFYADIQANIRRRIASMR